VLISTLGKKAFELAGEIADGALSWVCPVPYLLNTGIPALRRAAAANGRSASPPPLVAYVSVALSEDRHSIIAAGHRVLDMYAKLPFYAKMFADAGFPLTDSQMVVPDSLVDSLIVSGNEATVTERLTELLAAGLDELMVTLVPIKDAVMLCIPTHAFDRSALKAINEQRYRSHLIYMLSVSFCYMERYPDSVFYFLAISL
jgi:alkanesulfonate monooxygenase SsuD/methylene tetrahydromethanopterin reductase-like flavin-dependent oxidoreductase (luciferase family)